MKIKYLLITFLIIFGISCSSALENKEALIRGHQGENIEIHNKEGKRTNIKKVEKLTITNIYDPWEPFNRRMYYFNAKADRYFLIPIVKGYKWITPDPVEDGVSNFFSNLGEVKTFTNSVLQGKTKKALITLNRFAINSTFGLLGIFDVAKKLGLKKQKEDFGLTLAKYGVRSGPYLVLPIFGPSSLRDAAGSGIDILAGGYTDPLEVIDAKQSDIPIMLLKGLDARANINFTYHQTGSLFEYEFVRYFYFKLRELEGGLEEKVRVE